MIHNFYFTELSDNPTFDYRKYYNVAATVSLSDNLIQYISDSLQWVPSYNPAHNMEPQLGLNFYGPTVIKNSGAQKLHRISMAWSSLYGQSPPEIKLTGDYGWADGQGYESGAYEKHSMVRSQVVSCFDQLADTCLQVVNRGNTAFIMHNGI